MAKFYAVELTVTAIVQVADDHDEPFAEQVAMDLKRDIVADCPMEITAGAEVLNVEDLHRYGWDGMCLPYNGDGNTRLKDLLPSSDSMGRLSATAPELLAALREVIGWVPMGPDSWHTDAPRRAVERARAAIALATGDKQ